MAEQKEKRKLTLRCLNCFTRIEPEHGSTEMVCPKCGMGWRLSWPASDSVKIRGPMWDTVK